MWLIASISTCLAITGWIIIWYSKIISNQENSTQKNIYAQIWFQIWRIGGFFILWGILWLVGKTFSINLQVTTILTLMVAFLLIYMGLQILQFVPNITKLWIHLPKKFAHSITGFHNPKFSPVVWMLTFFIPCGFTQTAQLIAISSWDFLTGGLIMWAFALWTFPVLFLVGLGTSFFSWKKFPIIEMIIWSIILLFGLNTLVNASHLLPSLFTVNKTIQEENSLENLEYETVYFKHNGWNIIWNSIHLETWKNYKVIITPERNGMWCMWTLTIPTLSSKVYTVKSWVPIIYDLVNTQVWTHRIVCSSMWMVQWAIIIK
jgi:sulfite exporter TauE/SafE